LIGWLPHDPGAIFGDYLVPRSVAADGERIAPFARPADIDAIGRRLFANLADIEDFAHGSAAFFAKSLEGAIEGVIEFGLLGEGLRQLPLHRGALAAGHVAATQLGPQLLDVVVERNHRPLLLF
jgi:hypothetical protein